MAMAGDYAIGSDHWPGLSKLIEECGELLQVLGKILGSGGEFDHWDGSDLLERVVEELADVQAAMLFFIDENSIPIMDLHVRTSRKLELFRKWHLEQRAVQ